MHKKPFDIFKNLKRLSLAAFTCTALLLLVIFAESLMPGNLSAAQSAAISETIAQRFEIADSSDVIPEQISLTLPDESPDAYYIGDTVNLSVIFSPADTTIKTVIFTSSDYDIATINENGDVSFLRTGTVTINAISAANIEAEASIELISSGINPQNVPEFELLLPETLKIGGVVPILLSNGNENLNNSGFEISVTGDYAVLSESCDYLYGLAEGEITVTAAFEGITRSAALSIIPDPEYIPPETIVTDESITLVEGERLTLAFSTLPQNSPSDVFQISDDVSVAKIRNGKVIAYNEGTCTMTLSSVFNAECVATVTVQVIPALPAGLAIVGDDRALLNYATKYKVSFTNNPDERSVIWSIVEGKGEINDKGFLFPNRLGKLTLRATSVADSSVYAEKTVTVTLYKSFHLYIRKILGHFSLFALLGFGIAVTFLLLVSPKWLSITLSPVVGFVSAGLSEMFQLPAFTSGRFACWSDVFIDTLGAFSGFLIAMLIFGAIRLIWKKVSAESYQGFLAAYRKLTFKTAFKKQ